MSKYQSKLDGLYIIVALVLVVLSGFLVLKKVMIGALVNLMVLLFLVYLYRNTYYKIQNPTLRIRCGFIVNLHIDINTISKISMTNNPVSAPATSLDRLEILYEKTKSVLVSPKDKRGFISELQEINPNIIVIH